MLRSQSSTQPDAPGEFSLLPWDTAVEKFYEPWTQIVDSEGLNPTHLPGWLDVTIKSHSLPNPVEVVACHRQGALRALLPVFYRRTNHFGLSFKKVELVTNAVSYHADLIATVDAAEVFDGFFDAVSPWHILRVGNLLTDGEALRSLQGFAARNGLSTLTLPVEESPYIPIDSDWESFIASKNKKFRYKIRQRLKTLTENPRLSATAVGPDEFDSHLLDEILAIESKSWKARYGLDIGTRKKEKFYYAQLLPYLAKIGALHVDMLYFDDRPVAYSLCANWNGWFGQLKTSFDEDYARSSPGAIVVDRSIKAAFDVSANEFDFLGDMDKHKSAWTSHTRRHVDLFVYSTTMRSRLLYLARAFKSRLSPSGRSAFTKPETPK